jgi:hypothetical protein
MYCWTAAFPSFTNFSAPVQVPSSLGSVTLTKLTDLLRPGAPLFPLGEGYSNVTATYTISDTTPAAFPAGWAIDFTDFQIQYRYFLRSTSPIVDPLSRQQRRVSQDAYYIGARALTLAIVARNGANNYAIQFSGYWGVDAGLNGPASSDYVFTTTAAPTALECDDTCGYSERTMSRGSSDWTLASSSATPTGTVPIAVGTYMDGILSTLLSELSSASVSATWRAAALAEHGVQNLTNYASLQNELY